MTQHPSRRLFLLGLGASALLSAPACANAPDTSLRPVPRGTAAPARAVAGVEALIAEARLGGEVGFAVMDAATGKVLEGHNAARPMPPASVAKAITALYALDRLGAGHRFQTRLLANAPVAGGVLNGDLILAGGGDPALDTDGLADLARQLKAAGLREVRGRFLVWSGALPYLREIDREQPEHVGYNPSIDGIALNFNRVHFEWRREGGGWGVSMDARSDTLRPAVRRSRVSIADRELPVYTYAARGEIDDWSVARSALGKGGSRWLPVRQPALYAAEVFRVLCRAQGIALPEERVTASLPAGATVLASRTSAPLRDLLADMLRHSTNLTAEMVGLAATGAGGSVPQSLRTSAQAMNQWANARLGIVGADFVDHSGLGDSSRITAAAMAQAMVAAHRDRSLRPILREFALRDTGGKVLKNHPIRVDAKTGTLNFVSGLGGYMTAPGGQELAFAIFVADMQTRRNIPRAEREAPRGASGWNRRAKQLQQALIERWGATYGG